ncbi:hypothetical protein E8K88_11800 [Lampropedia aestuarii]|uniref:Recombinase RecT n=1 Tax=Lampropedia aestuarii TaxID=2562762 RepID=A0A4S5BJ65_9BURK|nr:hypothetical protein [Lampropedia aestuarii]THJ32380.1 hypothetical protein E8K88_11800 [Lampropedia aestuarii]
MSAAIATTKTFDLSPQTFDQAMAFSNMLADSDLVPKDYKGKPGNCMIAMQWGSELGLKPLQALQNLAVINGRPALWGDAVIALVRSSPICEYVLETDDGQTATCKVKRRGEPEQVRTFGMDDAKAAGLAGKQGPWTQYPKRMRQMRARAFALRDVFPDVLRGLPVAEEVVDAPKDMGMAQEVGAPVAPPKPAQYDDADFAKNLPAWVKAITTGRKSVDDVVATVGAKAPLTLEQIGRLRAAVAEQQPTDVQPKPVTTSADEIADSMTSASSLEQLDLAAKAIAGITQQEDRDRLIGMYHELREHLEGATQ